MVIVILVVASGYVCSIWLPRLLVAAIVLIFAITLSWRVKRATRALLHNSHRDPNNDRKPTRAQRRLMRASLRLALHRTELRSLFPGVVAQADAIVS
ncbi:MAG: hypothetical protein V4537_06115 [Pseudomonadota bacterium]